ncbi:MAG TPA: lytic transglycosylase domain-containing protein [Stenomitos sp.]
MIPTGLQDVLARIAQIQGSLAPMSQAPAQSFADAMQAATQAAKPSGVDPALVQAVIQAESGGDPKAVSKAGAMGLMQLMPETAQDMGVTDPFDPAQNVAGGTRYLQQMIDRFGNVPEALAAYNAGPGAVEKHGGIPPYTETRHYVQRVLDLYRQNQEGHR